MEQIDELQMNFPPLPPVQEIATGQTGHLIATIESDDTASIWDLLSRQKIAHFNSHWDSGGHRLAISENGGLCAIGAYQKYGVTLHNSADGHVIWRRKDLRKIQNVKFGTKREMVLVGIDEGSVSMIDASNGNDIRIVRGASEIWENPYEDRFFLARRSGTHEIADFENRDSVVMLKQPAEPVLDVAFGPDNVAVSEVAGPTTVYSLKDGRQIWKYSEPSSHDLRLCFFEGGHEFVAIKRNFEKGISSIVAYDALSGRMNRRIARDDIDLVLSRFAMRGSRMVTSFGNVIDTFTGATLFTLEFR